MESMFKFIRQFSGSFSAPGLLLGLVFFCISLTPSLLPRNFVVQGILSGVVFTAGYVMAKLGHWLWKFMELRELSRETSRKLYWPLLLMLTGLTIFTLGRIIVWQNSIRLLMEMAPIETAYPLRLCGIALVTALCIILLLRLLRLVARSTVNLIDRFLPRRIAIVVGSIIVTMLLLSFVNGVIIKSALNAMDESFATLNKLMDSEYKQPQRPQQSGSKDSLISWSDIGRNGKKYVVDGPTKEEISEITGKKSMQPIRVYAGFDTGETLEDRAQVALNELKRVGGFKRSTLIIATSTGTGWLDPSAVDTVEYIHSGNIASVSLQYSYLPSWLTLLVEPEAAIEASSALFQAVYNYWTTLPTNKRPKLYLYGLSLGALGSADAIDLLTMIGNPIDGALWSGPPFLSRRWNDLTRNRLQESPQWRPVYGDSSVVRFATQDGFPELGNAEWSSFRIVYLQHPSDPMSFFSSNLAYTKPDWLGPNRGPDVSPYLRWFPIVSALQVAFDVPMATSVPLGYGHNFAPAAYIDAWIEVTNPENWDEVDSKRLKEHFVNFNPSPT